MIDLNLPSTITTANLPNGVRTNGVELIVQSTKPTTRASDGSALVIGDLWKKTGQDFAEFDGTDWVSQSNREINYSTTASIAAAQILMYPIPSAQKIKTVRMDLHCLSQSVFDATTNRFDLSWTLQKSDNSVTSFATNMILNTGTQTTISTNETFSQSASSSADMATYKGFRVTISRYGTAQGWIGFKLVYKEIF